LTQEEQDSAAGRGYGAIIAVPSADAIERARITDYIRWLGDHRGVRADGYDQLWRWSVTRTADFWTSIWDYFDVLGVRGDGAVLTGGPMPDVAWFAGATVNYARNALRMARTDPSRTAVIYLSEAGHSGSLSYGELERLVAKVRVALARLGVGRGDRVAAYLPNSPQALIGLLATASLGAIWTSCSPDFGAPAVIDRFAQVSPKVLIAVDGYVYGGKTFDRRPEVAAVAAALPGLGSVIAVDYIGAPGGYSGLGVPTLSWDDLADPASEAGGSGPSGSGVSPDDTVPPLASTVVEYDEVPFDHPLWVLYSSGTTGLPKPIVHGHGGIVLEHLKAICLHQDLGSGDVFFWYTTTGWMMWNYLVGGLVAGTSVVCYDGSATYPATDALWRLAALTGVTYFGTGAPYLVTCMKEGLRPGVEHDLSRLRGIGSTGSPLPPEAFDWVFDAVAGGDGLLLGSFSGGTDMCTGFVGPCPLLPVRRGIIAGPCLGAKVEAFDAAGTPVIGEVGELVLTTPMPSMPVGFWGDQGKDRYRASYFAEFGGVWRHGDWIMILPDGGCVIYGRSDATLNRGGVRMGTSEFYRVVEALPEVTDSLIIDTGSLSTPGRLVLYLVLVPGVSLNEELRARVRERLRDALSPRHVPDEIHQVPAVPRTLSGKKLEIPVRKILTGTPVSAAADPDSLANPEVLGYFVPGPEQRTLRDRAEAGGGAGGESA
jgi:acetoacetyl-CoA synthetase